MNLFKQQGTASKEKETAEQIFKNQGIIFEEKKPFTLPVAKDDVKSNTPVQEVVIDERLVEVEIKTLVPNQNQMRLGYKDGFFSEQAKNLMQQDHIKNLADSIEANGLLQPIAIRPTTDANLNHVIYGHQRVLAHILLGKTHIKAMVVNVRGETEIDLLLKNLTENLARSSFNPAEVASVLETLSGKVSFAEIEKAVGVSYAVLCNLARLGALNKEIQNHLKNGFAKKRDTRVLYEISKLPQKEQWEIYKAHQEGRMSRPQVIQFVRNRLENKKTYSHRLKFFKLSNFKHPSIRNFLDSREDFYDNLNKWIEEYLKQNGFDFDLLEGKKRVQKTRKKIVEKSVREKIDERLEEQNLVPKAKFNLNEWLAEIQNSKK